jgi:hypothetical protein
MKDPYSIITEKKPGDNCINHYECMSGNCQDKCLEKPFGEICFSHEECEVGMYCDNTCKN